MYMYMCAPHTDITASGARCATFHVRMRFSVFYVAPQQTYKWFETTKIISSI